MRAGPASRSTRCPFSCFPALLSRSLSADPPPPPRAGNPAEFARRLTGFVPASSGQSESSAAGAGASGANASDAAGAAGAGSAAALSDALQRDGSSSASVTADAVTVGPESGSSLMAYLLAGTGVVTVAGAGVVAVLYFQDDRVQAAVDDAAKKVRERCVSACETALEHARPALHRGKEGAAELFALIRKHASPLGAKVVVMWHQAFDVALPYITATQAVALKYWAELSSHIVPPPLGNPPSHNGAARSSEEDATPAADAAEEKEDAPAAAASGAAPEASTSSSAINTTPARKPASGSAPPSESKDPDQADKPSPARNLAAKLEEESEAPVGETGPSDTASA